MEYLKNILFRSSLFQNIAKLVSANFIVQVIAFFLATIITRLYTNDDFGLLAKFMSIASLFTILSTARLEFAIILPKEDDEAHELVSLGLISAFFFSAISFLVIYFFSPQLNQYFAINSAQQWLFLLPAVVFLVSSFNLFINLQNRRKQYNKLIVGQAVLGVSNPIAAIFLNYITAWGLIQSLIFSNLLASLWLGFDFVKARLFSFKIRLVFLLKKYYRFPTYTMFHALVNSVSSNLPIFMLSAVFENYLIGLFTMAVGKVFKPINLFSSSIYQVLSKEMIDDLQQNKDVSNRFLKILAILFLIGFIPFLSLYLFAPSIFGFVFGAQWTEAGTYLKDLLPWLFMVYLVSSFTFIPNLLKQQKNAFLLEIIHLVLRFAALSLGIKANNLSVALSYYSSVGVLLLSLTLLWYYYLLKNKKQFNY